MNASRSDIDGLKAIQLRFREAIDAGDTPGRVHYNGQFHLQIGRMAHNAYLMPSLHRVLIDHSRLGMSFYRQPATADAKERMLAAVEQHDEIIDAIARHSAEEAGDLVRAHMDLSRKHMADYAIPEGLSIPLV
jgi:DNA-binding GntR family transcriptional regulator